MSIKLTQSEAQIERIIIDMLKKQFKDTAIASQLAIEDRLRSVIIDSIKAAPEYHSLLSGRLLGEFGLTDAPTKLDRILQVWSQDIHFDMKNTTMRITAIQGDFKNVLSLPEAQQFTNKGVSLDWLDWLLIKGDKTIIREYEIEAAQGRRSRTGLAVMVKVKKGRWKVPSQYAGTVNKNWVTRAIDDIPDSKIENIIIQEVTNKW